MRVQIELQPKARVTHVTEKRLLLRVRAAMSLKLTVLDQVFSAIFPGADVAFLQLCDRDL